MTHRVMLVDPHHAHLSQIERTLRDVSEVLYFEDFIAARRKLLARPPTLLITNLRLGPYNGIHLALLAGASHTRCLVYARKLDVFLARQVQSVGAFYIPQEKLPFVVPSFLILDVPARDHRDPAVPDRRKTFRGGRRTTDVRMMRVAAPTGTLVKFDPQR